MAPLQLGLFAGGAPRLDETFRGLRRTALAYGAWIDHQPGWLSGSDTLFAELRETMPWHGERRVMYGREVDTPRLLARAPDNGARHALLARMREVLSARYGEDFVDVTMAWYRDGHDSVAMHGDTTARDLLEATVATVSLGAPRRFRIEAAAGGASLTLELGGGDLLVMGGTCQRTWRHGIPKVAAAGPRIAVMFRPAWGSHEDR
ncbi:MAG: alpha-ketoglutarate-dependent dioxygenase AlkB [Deltaproteobacteria bacterium]|nr:alpha-ketoglutarate-dependent dioxygenase AlkB [Kofleriaceae bacterium]